MKQNVKVAVDRLLEGKLKEDSYYSPINTFSDALREADPEFDSKYEMKRVGDVLEIVSIKNKDNKISISLPKTVVHIGSDDGVVDENYDVEGSSGEVSFSYLFDKIEQYLNQ